MPPPGERLDRLVDAVEVVKGLLGGGPFTYDGEHHRARDATNRPPARAAAAPAACSSAARATGCCGSPPNTPTAGTRAGCGRPTPTAERLARLDARVRRASVATRRRCGARSGSTRCAARTSAISSGASSGCGEHRRRACSTASTSRRSAVGRLVGTVDEVREQVRGWEALGVDTLIARRRRGAVPGRRRPTTSSCCSRPARVRERRRRVRVSSGRGDQVATAAQDAAPFALGCAAPHAVLDAVEQRVLEALDAHRAVARRCAAPTRRRDRRTGRTRSGLRPGTARGASTRIPRGSRPRSPPLRRSLTARVTVGSTRAPGFVSGSSARTCA